MTIVSVVMIFLILAIAAVLIFTMVKKKEGGDDEQQTTQEEQDGEGDEEGGDEGDDGNSDTEGTEGTENDENLETDGNLEEVTVDMFQPAGSLTIVSNVNVRDKPSTQGTNVIKVAKEGEVYEFTAVESDGEWYDIILEDGSIGYVYKDYIKVN